MRLLHHHCHSLQSNSTEHSATMHISQGFISAVTLLSAPVWAANFFWAQLDGRSDVHNCKAILIALKASAVCAIFALTTDST
jgi:hypothetical protein